MESEFVIIPKVYPPTMIEIFDLLNEYPVQANHVRLTTQMRKVMMFCQFQRFLKALLNAILAV